MKLEIGNLGGLTRFLPSPAKIFDRFPCPVEHLRASMRLFLRPRHPVAHVAAEDRHDARVAALRFFRVERNEPLLEIDLFPAPGQQLTDANTVK
jgi:hypothetical protein